MISFLFLVIPLTLVSTSAESEQGLELLERFVQSESGFDGAVRVIRHQVQNGYGIVTVEVPYLDIHGNPKLSHAQMKVRMADIERDEHLPAFCHVLYEVFHEEGIEALTWCDQGWAVFTPHYAPEEEGGYPSELGIGEGYNLTRAMLQWVRRLPCIDPARIHLDGASQAGYMALAMAADVFPVSGVTADVPVVNWSYNFQYFETNKEPARYPQEDPRLSPMPVLCHVMGIVDMSYALYGDSAHLEAYSLLSPVSYTKRITAPVLILYATGDMLVPIEQMTRNHVRPFNSEKFPEGYIRDFDTLAPSNCVAGRVFEDVLTEGTYSVHVVPLQEGSYEMTIERFMGEDEKPEPGPQFLDRPWSSEHQWSLCYLDEGPPLPGAAHFSHAWAVAPYSFVKQNSTSLKLEQLTQEKLDYLLQRYSGKIQDLPVLTNGEKVNRLNFEYLERLDILIGLLTYAEVSEAHKQRLMELYSVSEMKPFGESIDLSMLKEKRNEHTP